MKDSLAENQKDENIKIKKARKVRSEITLEEFLQEKELDGVRFNQLSRKLINLVSKDDRKQLNPQDMLDLKEIQGLIEIAEI